MPNFDDVNLDDSATKVFVTRHGLTDWNLVGRRQGRHETNLSTQGLRGAHALGLALKRLEVDTVYSSPQIRCVQTSRVVGDLCGVEVVIVEGLQELDLGLTTGLTWTELRERHGDFLVAREGSKFSTRWPEGESYQDALSRVTTVLSTVAGDGFARPVIICHEMIAKAVLVALCGPSSDPTWSRRLPHGHIYEVDPVGGRAQLLSVEEILT